MAKKKPDIALALPATSLAVVASYDLTRLALFPRAPGVWESW
jgi:hypothetical protein